MRILLVEDTADLRRLFARLLRWRGFTVCEAADGQAALEALDGCTPDVVLTDLMMPTVDGIELTRRLRAMPAWSTMPVVAMTAGGSADMERRAREAGASEVLAKPVEIMTLIERLSAHAGACGAALR